MKIEVDIDRYRALDIVRDTLMEEYKLMMDKGETYDNNINRKI